jgi:hypothetical protein
MLAAPAVLAATAIELVVGRIVIKHRLAPDR